VWSASSPIDAAGGAAATASGFARLTTAGRRRDRCNWRNLNRVTHRLSIRLGRTSLIDARIRFASFAAFSFAAPN